MSPSVALLVGLAFGAVAGTLLMPLTRRELTASLARAAASQVSAVDGTAPASGTLLPFDTPRLSRGNWLILAAASGIIPAFMLYRVGWSLLALPPLLMLVGLVQLAYCDLTRRLLPKTLVYALGAVVVTSGVAVAAAVPDWEKLVHASLGGLVLFAVLFFINLMNPRWIAYGDVRLALVVGFGLAWVSPMALLDGFFYANLMAAVVGLVLIGLHRAKRSSGLPFGLYLALAAALVLVIWS